MVLLCRFVATGEKSADMVTDEGDIMRPDKCREYLYSVFSQWRYRTVSSGISGASHYTGTFSAVNRSPDRKYVAVSRHGNFFLTWAGKDILTGNQRTEMLLEEYRTWDGELMVEEAWAAGGSGILLRTRNGGKSWNRDKAADNIAANLYAVKFVDDKKGFVLGNNGVLLRYVG
ncbi:hypothetical protein Bca52824_019885 [Brassica carinata]|uniref:Photosynthesis system II assembly factor Ycf48/Hcf136-like domain-containing protein n=1 Tax=Brassica carinata TaxID=52824 RepID=A0A8X8B039_BRACI|nr:hypothetical protein Bca52824_019885 [Brassica carinata]